METIESNSAGAPAAFSRRPGRVVKPGEGKLVRAFGNQIEFMLLGEDTEEQLSIGMATVNPGGSPPPHVHHDEDEVFLILEGEYRVCLDGEWTTAGPGALVHLPRGCAHTFSVVGEKPGRHWTLTTAGKFPEFFAKSAEIAAIPGPPDFAKLGALAAEYGYSFVR